MSSIWLTHTEFGQLQFVYQKLILFPSGEETSCHAVKRKSSVAGEGPKDQAEVSIVGMSQQILNDKLFISM